MVDQERVCCLCGDVGFPDKLFRCSRCRFRFQHSYCSNYYSGSESSSSCLCDWCQSEARNNNSSSTTSTRHSSRRENSNLHIRSEYASGERIKLQDHQQTEEKVVVSPNSSTKNNSGVPSPRTAHRRYKLLKDVMC